MATRNQLLDALEEADKRASAGDEQARADAQEFARMIKELDAKSAAPPTPTVDSQYIRSALQGVTFKGADEAEAWVRSTFGGEDYDTVLKEVRQKIKAFEKDSPASAFLTETAGAALPAIVGTIATGGAGAAAFTFPALARLAGISALEGAAAGFGGAEGSLFNRLQGGATGAGVGLVAGPLARTGLEGAGKLGSGFLDFVRRRSGGRGGSVVENEIRKITEATGMTVDEIVDRIRSGEVMAEFPALMSAVRGYYAGGGAPAATIRQALTERPPMLRQEAESGLRQGLTPGATPQQTLLRSVRLEQQAAKDFENKLYDRAFKRGGVVEGPLLERFAEVLELAPQARKNVNENLISGRRKPFYTFRDGKVVIDRAVTFQDMELARRGIQDTVNEKFKSGLGNVGADLKKVEQEFRSLIDQGSQEISKARLFAAGRRAQSEAYKEGESIFNKDSEMAVEILDALKSDPGKLKMFKSGVMRAIGKRMETGNKLSLYQRLADPQTKEGRILRTVFPADQIEDVLGSIGRAAQSQRAAGDVLRQSATAGTLMAAARQGTGAPSPEDLLRATQGDIFSLTRLARQAINSAAPMLSEREKARVANVLVSQDPAIVRQALTDERALARLIAATTLGAQRITAPLPGLISIIGGGAAGEAFTGAQ